MITAILKWWRKRKIKKFEKIKRGKALRSLIPPEFIHLSVDWGNFIAYGRSKDTPKMILFFSGFPRKLEVHYPNTEARDLAYENFLEVALQCSILPENYL